MWSLVQQRKHPRFSYDIYSQDPREVPCQAHPTKPYSHPVRHRQNDPGTTPRREASRTRPCRGRALPNPGEHRHVVAGFRWKMSVFLRFLPRAAEKLTMAGYLRMHHRHQRQIQKPVSGLKISTLRWGEPSTASAFSLSSR